MSRRHKLSKRASKAMFKHTASQNGIHKRNAVPVVSRGGIRL